MNYSDSILDTVGNTPLVRLHKVAAELPVTVLAKVEALNPGGSIKDRIGIAMVTDAERRGVLSPGGKIIEEKMDLLRAYGAEIVVTPTSVPPDSSESYHGVAERLAREIPGAFRPCLLYTS